MDSVHKSAVTIGLPKPCCTQVQTAEEGPSSSTQSSAHEPKSEWAKH